MKRLISFVNSIHDFTYIFFMISVETSILLSVLSIYYTTASHYFADNVYYLRVACELVTGIKEFLLFTVIYSIIIEFVIRYKEKG